MERIRQQSSLTGKSLLTQAKQSDSYIGRGRKIPTMYAKTQDRFRRMPKSSHAESVEYIADPDSSRFMKEKRVSTTQSTHAQSAAAVFKNTEPSKADSKPEPRVKDLNP